MVQFLSGDLNIQKITSEPLKIKYAQACGDELKILKPTWNVESKFEKKHGLNERFALSIPFLDFTKSKQKMETDNEEEKKEVGCFGTKAVLLVAYFLCSFCFLSNVSRFACAIRSMTRHISYRLF